MDHNLSRLVFLLAIAGARMDQKTTPGGANEGNNQYVDSLLRRCYRISSLRALIDPVKVPDYTFDGGLLLNNVIIRGLSSLELENWTSNATSDEKPVIQTHARLVASNINLEADYVKSFLWFFKISGRVTVHIDVLYLNATFEKSRNVIHVTNVIMGSPKGVRVTSVTGAWIFNFFLRFLANLTIDSKTKDMVGTIKDHTSTYLRTCAKTYSCQSL